MAPLAPMLFDTSNVLEALFPFYMAGGSPFILGVLYLAIVRDLLFRNRVLDYNTPDMLQHPQPCTPEEIKYRTADGRCNNLNQTGMGMTNLRYGRSALKDPFIPDPGLMEPDPYLIAEKLLKNRDGKRQVGAPYSMWMTSWINFNLHDWVFHDTVPEDPYELQWGPKETDTFKLKRTKLDSENFTRNTQTPWWDASQVYGTTDEHATELRVPGKCEMRLDEDGDMPLGPDGLPEGGFIVNWWSGVEILHTLFVKEHNYVCGMLRKAHPSLPEHDLYHISRMVVAAIQAKIHTVEWTPALLNNAVLNVTMHNNWYGFAEAVKEQELVNLKHHPTLKEKFGIEAHAAILKLAQHMTPDASGVGDKTNLWGVPYSFTEDFVSSYRMHPLIPDQYVIDGQTVKATDMINENARTIIKKFGHQKIVDAWGHQPPTTLTLHNYPEFLTHVHIPGEDGPRNMAVVDIVRDRERGMPRFNQARRQYGMKPAEKFEDITDNAEWAEELKSVYKSVEDVDFLVGCLAESPRPNGFIISDTAFHVFIISASRRIFCDRFYQEAFSEENYTKEGLDHIQGATFKSLLLRHYPELKDSIGDVNNAFFAWTGTPLYSVKPEHDEL